MEFFQWMEKLSQFLNYRPTVGGVEEECIRNTYYTQGKTPEQAAFMHKQSLQGEPAKDRTIRHF